MGVQVDHVMIKRADCNVKNRTHIQTTHVQVHRELQSQNEIRLRYRIELTVAQANAANVTSKSIAKAVTAVSQGQSAKDFTLLVSAELGKLGMSVPSEDFFVSSSTTT